MKGSASKFVLRAKSIRNSNKLPFNFRFDLLIERVERLLSQRDVVVTIERSSQILSSTKPATVDNWINKASFGNEQISADVTLFKTKQSELCFSEKIIKLVIKQNNSNGRTLGKIHVNLGDHADFPSGSKRISAKLTNGAILIATMRWQLLSLTKGGNSLTSKSWVNSGEADNLEQGFHRKPRSVTVGGSPKAFLKNPMKSGRVGSKKLISLVMGKKKMEYDDSKDFTYGGDKGNIERLQKENQWLKKQLRCCTSTINGEGFSSNAEISKVLQNQIRELRNALEREPIFVDLVKELKETKMALAMVHLEKEEAMLELAKYKRNELTAKKSKRISA